MKTKFAIGCLVQWYEANMIHEYFDSLRDAINEYNGTVEVDILLTLNQDLEKAEDNEALESCIRTINEAVVKYKFNIRTTEDLVTIADYRRTFNDDYCNLVDVLIWGESDMLAPRQMFNALHNLHISVNTPKYLATFGICKMWDESWKPLEHVEFTNKPFIEGDTENWWSIPYTMKKDEMNEFNDTVESLDVNIIQPHKFNGCGLVISSEVIKSGVNIPKSVFFIHEDTAFMMMTQKILGNIPQYHFSNILIVHNRKHPKKRMFIKDEESNGYVDNNRKKNKWYVIANKFCEENVYNLYNPNFKSNNWKDVWELESKHTAHA
jgi:hypothetical protein